MFAATTTLRSMRWPAHGLFSAPVRAAASPVTSSAPSWRRSTKLRLYAEAGIPEYWVVDCVAESIEIHRTPQADGYREVVRVTEPTATVALQAFPDVVLTLAEIFA